MKRIGILLLLLLPTKLWANTPYVCPPGCTATLDATKHLVCLVDPTPVPPTPVSTATPVAIVPTATPKANATPQPTATPVAIVPTATPVAIVPTPTPSTYRSMWVSNTGSTKLTTGSTSYMNVSGAVAASGTEANVATYVSVQFTARAIACTVDVAPGVGKSWTINLRDNGATSLLGCTISGTATSCVNDTNAQIVYLNHSFDYRILPVSSPFGSSMRCALEVDLPPL